MRRFLLALPISLLALGYVGLRVSFERQKRRYVSEAHHQTLRRARCFSQDVNDYALRTPAPSQPDDSTLSFCVRAGAGGDGADVPHAVTVAASFFEAADAMWSLDVLYGLYAELTSSSAGVPPGATTTPLCSCTVTSEEDAVMFNLRQALKAVLEHRLAAMCASESRVLSPEEACRTMAVAVLSQRLRHPVPLDPVVFTRAKRQFTRDGSTSWSVFIFLRSLCRTCSWKTLVASGVVVAFFQTSVLEFLSPAYLVSSDAVCLAELVRHQAALPPGTVVRFVDFAVAMLTKQSPGQLLAIAMLLGAVGTLITTVRDAVGNLVLHEHNDRLREAAVLAVARMDYCADPEWPIPSHVYGALSSVTNFTFYSVDFWVGQCLARVDLCLTWLAHPVQALVLRCVKEVLLRCETLVGQYDNLIRCRRGSTQVTLFSQGPAGDVHLTACHKLARNSHYGLTLWLGAVCRDDDTVWAVAAETRFPSVTRSDRQLSAGALANVIGLEHVPTTVPIERPYRRAVCAWLSRKQALLLSGDEEDAPAAYAETVAMAVDDGASLQLARRHGLAPSLHGAVGSGAESLWACCASHETARAVVDRLLQSCESLPAVALVLLSADSGPRGVVSPSQTAAALERLSDAPSASEPAVVFGTYSPFLYELEALRSKYWSRSDYAQSMAYLSHLIVTPPAIDCCHSGKAPPTGAWSLTFEHVWFRYPGRTDWTLQDICFTVPAGRFLGIIGYSGAGKTTILSLVSRLYAPTAGRILINGDPIESFPARALRRRIGHAWQAKAELRFLEQSSVESNVAYGDLARATTASVRAALQRAHALSFVESRARGLQNTLDPRTLSGGEVERLSLSRTFMKGADDAGVYLLDECTSALDSSTEEAVLQPVLQTATTVVMVTHRLSSIRSADLILVMDQGRIAERGSWTTLVSQHHQSQTSGSAPTLFGTLLVSQGGMHAD